MIKRIWAITLTVSDLKRAVSFYERVLGLSKKYEFNDYAGFDCGGVEIGIKTWGEFENPRQGEPCIDFLVENVDDTFALLSEQGIGFHEEPKDTPWGGRIAVFSDPDGNALQLTQINWGKYFSISASQ